MNVVQGSCHCGRIRFSVEVLPKEVLACDCSICTKKGFLHLIVTRAQFRLLSGNAGLSTYTFNTHVAQHWFCATCGVHPFYVPRSDPDKIDVNARCLEGVDLTTLTVTPFDGKNWEQTMADRQPR